MIKNILRKTYIFMIFVFLYAPILTLIVLSFTNALSFNYCRFIEILSSGMTPLLSRLTLIFI